MFVVVLIIIWCVGLSCESGYCCVIVVVGVIILIGNVFYEYFFYRVL